MEFEIQKIAELCRIHLKPDEMKKIEKDMQSILDYVKKLDGLNTDNVEPTSHVLDLENVFRPDEVQLWDGKDKALKNAPLSEGNFFKVPKVVDKE